MVWNRGSTKSSVTMVISRSSYGKLKQKQEAKERMLEEM